MQFVDPDTNPDWIAVRPQPLPGGLQVAAALLSIGSWATLVIALGLSLGGVRLDARTAMGLLLPLHLVRTVCGVLFAVRGTWAGVFMAVFEGMASLAGLAAFGTDALLLPEYFLIFGLGVNAIPLIALWLRYEQWLRICIAGSVPVVVVGMVLLNARSMAQLVLITAAAVLCIALADFAIWTVRSWRSQRRAHG